LRFLSQRSSQGASGVLFVSAVMFSAEGGFSLVGAIESAFRERLRICARGSIIGRVDVLRIDQVWMSDCVRI